MNIRNLSIDKVKKIAITVFCITTAAGNIIQYSDSARKSEIVFYETDQQSGQTNEAVSTSDSNSVQDEGTASSLKAEAFPSDTNSENASDAENEVLQDEPVQDADANSGISSKINLNTATSEELQTIKGIGPAKADAIIEYRNNYGGFVSIEEITEVKGIGESTFNKIKEYITVN